MKLSKIPVALTVGVVAGLALAACSSGGDQAAESPTSQEAREAAAAPTKKLSVSKDGMPKGQTKLMIAQTKGFEDVKLTHNAEAKCTQDHSVNGRVEWNCTNVTWNVFGDAVFVRIPNSKFHIEIENVGSGSSVMRSTQRDYAYSAIQSKNEPRDGIIKWEAPRDWTAAMGWGAGVESYYHYQGDSVNINIAVFLN